MYLDRGLRTHFIIKMELPHKPTELWFFSNTSLLLWKQGAVKHKLQQQSKNSAPNQVL